MRAQIVGAFVNIVLDPILIFGLIGSHSFGIAGAAIAKMKASVFIIVLRQVILPVPLAWVLHFWGLGAVWWTFPVTEIVVAVTCWGMEKG